MGIWLRLSSTMLQCYYQSWLTLTSKPQKTIWSVTTPVVTKFNQNDRIMTKKELAQLLVCITRCAKKKEYSIHVCYPQGWEKFGETDGKRYFVESASNAAGTKLIKGRITLKGEYLVSRGKELPFCKPNAVAEYSSHWPYDFCYFYRL